MSFDSKMFRSVLGRFATGVTIVTADRGTQGGRVGVTVNSFASVSLAPPLVLYSLAHEAFSYDALVTAPDFCINILSDTQQAVSDRFARSRQDKFDGIDTVADANGQPMIRAGLARLSCKRETTYDGGDHTIVIGRVTGVATDQAAGPLVYYAGSYHRLGSAF